MCYPSVFQFEIHRNGSASENLNMFAVWAAISHNKTELIQKCFPKPPYVVHKVACGELQSIISLRLT